MNLALDIDHRQTTVWVNRHDGDDTERLAVHLSAAVTGQRQMLPNLRYWATGAVEGELEQYTLAYCDEVPRHSRPVITISLTVENNDELYPDVTAYVVNAVIPVLPDTQDADESGVHDADERVGESGVVVGTVSGYVGKVSQLRTRRSRRAVRAADGSSARPISGRQMPG